MPNAIIFQVLALSAKMALMSNTTANHAALALMQWVPLVILLRACRVLTPIRVCFLLTTRVRKKSTGENGELSRRCKIREFVVVATRSPPSLQQSPLTLL